MNDHLYLLTLMFIQSCMIFFLWRYFVNCPSICQWSPKC